MSSEQQLVGADEGTPPGVTAEPQTGVEGEAAQVAAGEDGAAGQVPQVAVAPEVPHEFSPEEVSRALETPLGRQMILENYRALTEQVKSEAAAQAEQAELEGLIASAEESGDFTDVGKKLSQRHREATRRQAARAEVTGEVVSAFSNSVLPALMSDPEVQEIISKMTPEERRAIDPKNPKFDTADDFSFYKVYLPEFRKGVQAKAVELRAEALANEKFEALKKARANELTGQVVSEGTPNLPAAASGGSPRGTASQLLSKGFEEDKIVLVEAPED